MANSADGTDGRGAPSLGKSVTSGKSSGDFGKGSAKSMAPGGKTLSGANDGAYGTKAARNSGGNANGSDGNTDRSQISKTGGRF